MIPLIMAGVMAAQALEKGKLAKGQAKIDKFQAKSATKVENTMRATQNVLSKAKGDLARYQQARGNKYKLIQGAEAVESQQTNVLRLTDQAVRGGFDQRIAASEEAGALVAASGAAGVGGGSIDMIDASNRIRQQRVTELQDRSLKDATYDAERNIDQTIRSTILGLDDIQFNDDINFMQAQTPYIKEPSWAEIGMQAGMQFASTFNSMDGFQGMGNKIGGWLGQGPSGSKASGYSPEVLGKWSGPTTQLK
ncbi:internal virion protein [Pseudomonas phage VSW-3]|uniref:Internal virion protein n=1 Tax=Pseudomonas phage VSW-3 TaxID=1852562 RepID=A0A173GCV1_9CAUD|nr:internal virion protein [Pseudomonas phage VSW-3]ANH51100.1 hypothetical protein VSW3_24 [Pseudomonas phage VSW-3]